MGAKKDGGPAFPTNLRRDGCDGLTKREWLASQALQGLLASPDRGNMQTHQHYTEQAVIFADALLKELDK